MSSTLLLVITMVIAVIGLIVLISGSVLWGIILLAVAGLVGIVGDSLLWRRPARIQTRSGTPTGKRPS
jgi:hypothetical protein